MLNLGNYGIDKKHGDNMEKLEQEFLQIQQDIKIENSRDGTKILNQVEIFIDRIKSLQDNLEENNRPIKEEKALLVEAAKRFQETIKMIKKNGPLPAVSS